MRIPVWGVAFGRVNSRHVHVPKDFLWRKTEGASGDVRLLFHHCTGLYLRCFGFIFVIFLTKEEVRILFVFVGCVCVLLFLTARAICDTEPMFSVQT